VLDALLVASCSVPASASISDAVTTLARAVTDLFANIAIGVRVASADAEAITVRCAAHPLPDAEPPADSARLFPDYASERAFTPELAQGVTIHLASDDAAFIAEGTAWDVLLDRLGRVLQAAIERARDATRREGAVVESLRAQVAHSERLASVGQIAASIVHELNNPLTSIVAYSDFLWKKGVTSGSDASDVERLARINEAAERILRFSRDLIAYARPSTEGPTPVAIHDVLDRALVFCEHVLSQTHVVVERSYGDVGLVSAVGSQLTQVFVNLFTNACQAMGPVGGKLTVATSATADRRALSIRVGDEGHGIEPGHLERIFDPFFTTRVDGTGTGLGLSIVYNIVRAHGGRVYAERAAAGGAEFIVELPILAER
jgi:signal transduction histidine kinase